MVMYILETGKEGGCMVMYILETGKEGGGGTW